MTAEEEIEHAVLLAGPIYDTAAAVAAIEDIIRKRAAAELRAAADRLRTWRERPGYTQHAATYGHAAFLVDDSADSLDPP